MRLSTTSIDGIPLLRDEPTSGIAVNLAEPARLTTLFRFEGGWSIEIAAGSSACVVRGCDLRGGLVPTFGACSPALTRGLDLLCINDDIALSAKSVADNRLVFWPQDGSLMVWWVGTGRVGPAMSASINVANPDGSQNNGSSPARQHHPSYTHFRRSQLERDLSDSYRHAYLALESILDTIHPQRGLREGEWISSALAEANTVAPIPDYDGSGSSPVDQASRRWYTEERLRIFHSKPSRSPAVDLSEFDYDYLLQKKQELLSYYVSLAKATLGLSRADSMMTYYGFEQFILSALDELRLGVVPIGDRDATRSGTKRPLYRTDHPVEPNGRGVFECTGLQCPRGQSIGRLEAQDDTGNAGVHISFDPAVSLKLDELDSLSLQLHMKLTIGHYRWLFDS